ncbi:MAG: hypothetical protein WAO07_18010, partial [Desulfobacterales bacterium]
QKKIRYQRGADNGFFSIGLFTTQLSTPFPAAENNLSREENNKADKDVGGQFLHKTLSLIND